MRQFAVIGLGKLGVSVANTLSKEGQQVLAIDNVEDKISDISEVVTHAVQIDAIDEKALKAVGIEDIDVAIVSVGSIESSILITLILKELGIKEIVVRAISPSHGKVLRKIGATRVVFPEKAMGERLAKGLLSPKVLEQIELSEEHSIVEAVAPEEFIGKSLQELDVRARFGVNIIAIRKKTPHVTEKGETAVLEELNVAPLGSDLINEGDILVVIGSNKNIEKLKTMH